MAVWHAPGRINLIGEHTDYNDGFVLPMALPMGCTASVEGARDGWSVVSTQTSGTVSVSPSGLTGRDSVPEWASYVLGALWLLHDDGVEVPPVRISVDSDVPTGAGLSSSAALVCSVVCALDEHLGLGLDAAGLLALSRRVENDAVGAPTGGMDQLISLRGEEGHALFCDMRDLTSEAVPFTPADSGLALLVVDTRAPHRLVDGEYAARRRGCEAAARQLGVSALRDVTDAEEAVSRLDDEELQRYARHVVTEDARVLDAVEALRAGRLDELGPLFTASHASMRDDFRITVPEVDTAAETLLSAGAIGSRMTGGGFGGCVIGLVPAAEVDAAGDAVRRAFADAGFGEPSLFTAEAAAGARSV
ncbi:galactokinase [Nocardioides sp. BE266]|uniref:galactokinase n=1 Tax=Nocardioides sp. BE266 TaxID=2817725 RepID=UPI00285B96BD|nr:galactokinase [Nocardioides sp. BE266]MDR7252571.1 galactokinase [Nocardioides sp. BE266]